MVEYTFKCLCGETAGTFDSKNCKAKIYCHCHCCREVSGGGAAVEAVALAPNDVKLTKDSDLKEFKLRDTMSRFFCGKCGSMVYNTNKFGLWVISNNLIQDKGDDVKPAIHICYESRLYDVTDDLPKFLDFPEAFGGTENMAE